MTTNFNMRGFIAPVMTPFNDDYTINFKVIPEYINLLANRNIHGILVNGTTGEGMSMSVSERKQTAEAFIKAAKPRGIHVMVQVGGAPLPDVLELARHAESIKADSLLSLPELYFKPRTAEELVEYLLLISRAAPQTPLLYYHYPVNSGVNLNMEQFIPLAKERLPTFHGIKYTSKDLHEGIQALRVGGKGHAVFLGSSTLIASAMTMGFDSVIGTTFNIVPQYAHQIKDFLNKGDIVNAKKSQESLIDILDVLFKEGPSVPVMKAAMEIYTGINVVPPRKPQKEITQLQKNRIRDTLKEMALL